MRAGRARSYRAGIVVMHQTPNAYPAGVCRRSGRAAHRRRELPMTRRNESDAYLRRGWRYARGW